MRESTSPTNSEKKNQPTHSLSLSIHKNMHIFPSLSLSHIYVTVLVLTMTLSICNRELNNLLSTPSRIRQRHNNDTWDTYAHLPWQPDLKT